MELNTIHLGDAMKILRSFPDGCIDCCVTSPPYYLLRDYGAKGQIGLEDTPEKYIRKLTRVFEEVRRVLKPNGTLWVNIGDSYAGSQKGAAKYPDNAMNYKQGTNRGLLGKPSTVKKLGNRYKSKDLIGIPWMLAFSLRNAGWYLRQDIIWQKLNPMPESVRDRCTKSHEYIFLLSKSQKYYFDAKAIMEPATGLNNDLVAGSKGTLGNQQARRRSSSGYRRESAELRNKRSVWSTSTSQMKESHFATFPEKLIEPCILSGCPEGGVVLDPFMGSGTTGIVALLHGRNYIGIEINPVYCEMARRRIFNQATNLFNNNLS